MEIDFASEDYAGEEEMISGEVWSEEPEEELPPVREKPVRKKSGARKPAGKKPAGKASGVKKARKKKKNHALAAIMITILVLVMAGVGALGYLAYQTSLVTTVYPGVTVEGIDLSGMTRKQAAEALLPLGAERYDGLAVTADLPLGNTLTISAYEAGLTYSTDRAADAAWGYGRDGNMFTNMLTYVQAEYLGRSSFSDDGGLDVTLNEDTVRAIVAEAAVSIDEQLLASGMNIEGGEIRIMKGASSLTLDEEVVVEQFVQALLNGDSQGFTYESVPDTDEVFDFQGLYDELYAEKVEAQLLYAKDYLPPETSPEEEEGEEGQDVETVAQEGEAEKPEEARPAREIPELPEGFDFEGQPYKVTQSVVGVTFDVEEAQRLWDQASYGDTVVVPLTITEPEVSTEDIENMLFADNLSKNWTMVRLYDRDYCEEVRTTLSGSTKDRISNVKKACEAINGVMLMPGDTFSYNDALGERTAENGWLYATAYANGEVRQELGGGICQVSSTLYNAVLYSNLEIVERTCHQFQVAYLPWGMDATVSWGWPDFKFRNDQDYPIMIVAWVDDETNECCVQIKGTDVDHIYVIMKFSTGELFDDSGTYFDASGNPVAVGRAAATWRLVFRDGDDYKTDKPISEEYEAYSTYNYHTEDILAKTAS